jgi:hypothetical protein
MQRVCTGLKRYVELYERKAGAKKYKWLAGNGVVCSPIAACHIGIGVSAVVVLTRCCGLAELNAAEVQELQAIEDAEAVIVVQTWCDPNATFFPRRAPT